MECALNAVWDKLRASIRPCHVALPLREFGAAEALVLAVAAVVAVAAVTFAVVIVAAGEVKEKP